MESRHNQSNKANAGQPAILMAMLVDAEKKAKGKAATVQVTVKGIALIDPAKVNERPRRGQGHLHYQVDNGPVIATTTTKLSFHELSSGGHRIVVMLAGSLMRTIDSLGLHGGQKRDPLRVCEASPWIVNKEHQNERLAASDFKFGGFCLDLFLPAMGATELRWH
jgi:hypothetical protein